MSRISKRQALLILSSGILIGVLVTLGARRLWSGTNATGNAMTPGDVSRLSTYHIPDSLSFCGEKMPLSVADVRRRMEQSFYVELSDAQIILDLKRSAVYFPYIEKELSKDNLPQDLKYLPVAESALRNLVSYRGAAGIWQFTKDTARRYGLVVNYYVDERYNFRKATDAALRYLSDLHTEFGSWALAAAAYNMGQNGIKATVRYQMTNDYYDLHLNDETSRFVFRIVAIKQIMSHYRKYGFDLTSEDFYVAPKIRTVDVHRILDIAAWARQQGASYEDVKFLNPWMKRRVLPYGHWTVSLPASSRPAMLASADTIGSQDSVQQATYVVKRGDSLIRIARMYGVTVNDLMAWNQIPDRGYLRAGQKLSIPASAANLDMGRASN